MPDASALPERMRPILPENGYESPNEFSNGMVDLEKDAERRRTSYFWGGSNETRIGFTNSIHANGRPEMGRRASEGRQVQSTRPVAIRDRIGCYTWTWFTMVPRPQSSLFSR